MTGVSESSKMEEGMHREMSQTLKLKGLGGYFFLYGVDSHIIGLTSLTIDVSFSSCLYRVYLRTDTCECFCIYYDETSYIYGGHDDVKRSRKCRDRRKGWIGARLTHSSLRGSADTLFFYGMGSHIMCRRSL